MEALWRYHAFFSGAVQGVGFRRTAQILAQDADLSGWVRNLEDGRVELVAEGRAEYLEAFLAELSLRFSIDGLELREEAGTGEFQIFEILRGQ